MKQKLLIFGIFLIYLSSFAQQGIIGGNITTIQENPWQVSIRATNNYNVVDLRNQHLCGGSIIAPNWILTAAHCVTNVNGGIINVNEITIAAGITQRTDNINGQYRNVIQIIRHPNYNPINLANDVALILVNANFNYNINVRQILLTNSLSQSSVGTIGRVTGWGDTTSGGVYTPAAQLQRLNLPIISTIQANNLNTGNIPVTNSMIPLFQTGVGVAPGDSGGPLTVLDNGIRYLIGCSSWGEFPKDNKPTIYTDLYDYRTWISNNVPLPDIIGTSPICFSPNKIFNLSNANNPSTVSWQVSSNLQIINSSNSNITIRALSSSTNGSGFILATFNGITVRKDVQVGTQNLGIDNYMIMDETPELTVEKKNANGYNLEWRINGVIVNSNQGGTTWMRFNLNNYNYLCTNGKLTLAMRENGPCGWSNYVYRQYNCSSGEYLYNYSPNPATDVLTITKNNQSSNISTSKQNPQTENLNKYMIYDFNGSLILKGNLLNDENNIDVSTLKKGTYILNIQIDNNIEEKHQIIIN